jgi:hypothetical protein
MMSALRGDRRPLADMLRCKENEITDDLREFLAWLIEKRDNHRPKVPAKFKMLKQIADAPAMFDAVMEFEYRRTAWKRSNPGRRFPYEDIARR